MFAILRGGICILGRHFFTWLRAQRAAFLGLEGARLWLWNSGEAFASRGAVFRFRVLGWEAQRADFFGFRGRLVVFDELWGGTCTLGRRFHLFGSSEGGIFSGSESTWLWLRNSGVVSASWEVVFQEQRALGWSGRVQRAAFIHVHRAPCRCRAQGPACSLNGVIPEQVLKKINLVRTF